MVAESARFRDMSDGTRVLDHIEQSLRAFGATMFLAAGLPLPGQPLEPLLLRATNAASPPACFDRNDPVFQASLRRRNPFARQPGETDDGLGASPLLGMVGPVERVGMVCVPVHAFPPYQGCVVAAGLNFAVDPLAVLVIGYFCIEGFRRLLAIGDVAFDRPGDLSVRERKVVELSAKGKTAGDIAGDLNISQRTVHAHLQNASFKLRASNKTQTVVEALRYGQIEV